MKAHTITLTRTFLISIIACINSPMHALTRENRLHRRRNYSRKWPHQGCAQNCRHDQTLHGIYKDLSGTRRLHGCKGWLYPKCSLGP